MPRKIKKKIVNIHDLCLTYVAASDTKAALSIWLPNPARSQTCTPRQFVLLFLSPSGGNASSKQTSGSSSFAQGKEKNKTHSGKGPLEGKELKFALRKPAGLKFKTAQFSQLLCEQVDQFTTPKVGGKKKIGET